VYLPGTELTGVIPALPFLEGVEREEKLPIGKKVVVIGGGNAAIDSARTARRLGADVTIVYRRERKDMPAIPERSRRPSTRAQSCSIWRPRTGSWATPRAA